MKYGFIGTGNMGTAIIKGIVNTNKEHKIFAYDANQEALQKCAAATGATACKDAGSLIAEVEVLVLAVKPVTFPKLLGEISASIQKHKPLLISIAAGITCQTIEDLLGFPIPIIRVMPNINVEVNAGMSAVCGNHLAAKEQIKTVMDCFNLFGSAIEIEEHFFAVFSSIAGCSPAFTFLFIDSLAKGALKNGLNKKQAIHIAAQAVLGSAKMILETNEHPMVLADKVCSPGGTTIEGLCALEDFNFESAIVHAIDRVIEKDNLMSKK